MFPRAMMRYAGTVAKGLRFFVAKPTKTRLQSLDVFQHGGIPCIQIFIVGGVHVDATEFAWPS